MRTPSDAMIQAGAKALAGGKPARPEHHWDALAVWRAMQAASIIETARDAEARDVPRE